MISTYPEFSKLDLSQLKPVTKFTDRFEPFSDFNFTSLFCWNTDGSTEVSWLNDNLVVRMPDYLDGHTTVYSLLGDNLVEESLKTLLAQTNKLTLVPEAVIQAMQDKSAFIITEDEDNFDYVYDLDHLSDLPGSNFKKKRNKANVFVKAHENYELVVKVTHSLEPNQAEMLRSVDRQWAKATPRDEGDILAERKALDVILENSQAFKPIIVEVWVDGSIKAFSINEIINQDYAICHFEKALKTHHEHLNTFLTIEVAKKLRAAGCRWANWEQDLGLDGLRRSKRSYHPVRMLKKYTVSTHGDIGASNHSYQ